MRFVKELTPAARSRASSEGGSVNGESFSWDMEVGREAELGRPVETI